MTAETILPNSNPGPVSAPVDQAALATLKPDQLAALNATRTKYGLPAYAIEKPADKPNVTNDPTIRETARALLKSQLPGKTDAEYDELLSQAGHTNEALDKTAPKKDDAVFHSSLQGPADGKAYDFSKTYVGRNFKGGTQALTAFDAEARTALKAAEVPTTMAAGLLGAMLDAGQEFSSHTTTAQRTLYDQTQKAILANLKPEQVTAAELAGDPIEGKVSAAPGGGALGGVKVATRRGWFAARPSGTEPVYKLYAESFAGAEHLRAIQEEAQQLLLRVFAGNKTNRAESV